MTFRIKRGSVVNCCWVIVIPPWDFTLGNRGIEGGRFANNSWGFKAYVTILGNNYGVFISNQGDFKFGNVEQYKLMTPETLAALQQKMRRLDVSALEGVRVAANGDIVNDVSLGTAETAMFILGRTGAQPTLTLQTPAGTFVTPDNLPANITYAEYANYKFQVPAQPGATARLRLVHAAATAPTVTMQIADALGMPSSLTAYGFNSIGAYTPVSGTVTIQIVRADNPTTVVVSATRVVDGGADYTLALTDFGGASTLTWLSDQNAPRYADEARVRLVNLSGMTQTLGLHHSGGLRLVKEISLTTASEYVAVENGATNLTVRTSDTTAEVGRVSDVAAEQGHIYSLFVLPPASAGEAPTLVLNQDTVSAARLRVINAGPTHGALDVWLQDETGVKTAVVSNVAYATLTDYQVVSTGVFTALVTPAGNAGTILFAQELALDNMGDYTLVAAPTTEGAGTWASLALTDDNLLPESGKVRVRLLNLATSAALNLVSDEGLPFQMNVGYNQDPGYSLMPGGVYTLSIRTLGGSLLATLPGTDLRDGQSYTLIAFGNSGAVTATVATDLQTDKSVQTIYTVQQPQPGIWKATYNPQPTDRYAFLVLGTSPMPVLSDLAVTQLSQEQARLSWRLASAPADTLLGVYANRESLTHTEVITDGVSGIAATVVITDYTGPALAYDLTLTDTGGITNTALQTTTVDLSRLQSGVYHLWLDVDDGRTMPVRRYAPQAVTIAPRAWLSTWSPAITPTAYLRRLGVAWTSHADPDVLDYAVEISGPGISSTQVITVGDVLDTGFGGLEPEGAYTLTILARRSPTETARSQAIVAVALGAPLTLTAQGSAHRQITIGQPNLVTLTLSTPLAEYPEPVGLMAPRVPSGLALDLPSDLLYLTSTGLQIVATLTATEYLTPGIYLLPIRAQGVGAASVVTITLEIPAYQLNVYLAGDGEGLVVSDVGGIDCALSCTQRYAQGVPVALTAYPLDSGMRFAGWSGAVDGTINPITVTMTADKVVTATFAINTYTLTPLAGAGGNITPTITQTVNYGASQTFTITADTGYHILDVGVDGVSQGAISVYTFDTVTANHTITAAFAINTYTLSVDKAGTGSGTVSLNPNQANYPFGTVVTLTAVHSATSVFAGWIGTVVTTTNPLVLTMEADQAVTALFQTYQLFLPLMRR